MLYSTLFDGAVKELIGSIRNGIKWINKFRTDRQHRPDEQAAAYDTDSRAVQQKDSRGD